MKTFLEVSWGSWSRHSLGHKSL